MEIWCHSKVSKEYCVGGDVMGFNNKAKQRRSVSSRGLMIFQNSSSSSHETLINFTSLNALRFPFDVKREFSMMKFNFVNLSLSCTRVETYFQWIYLKCNHERSKKKLWKKSKFLELFKSFMFSSSISSSASLTLPSFVAITRVMQNFPPLRFFPDFLLFTHRNVAKSENESLT